MSRPKNLSSLSSEDLTRLLRALHRGSLPSPVTRSSLIGSGFGSIEDAVEPLVGQPQSAAQAIVAAVLGERAAGRTARPAVLAYTGMPLPGTLSRDTLEHVRGLFGAALESLDVVGVSLGDERRLMRTLASTLEGRTLKARLVLDGRGPDAETRARAFVAEHFPRVVPEVYLCTARALTARVVVADGLRVLLTSAELTGSEDDERIDAGVLLEDRTFAHSLTSEWQRLITAGVFVRL